MRFRRIQCASSLIGTPCVSSIPNESGTLPQAPGTAVPEAIAQSTSHDRRSADSQKCLGGILNQIDKPQTTVDMSGALPDFERDGRHVVLRLGRPWTYPAV